MPPKKPIKNLFGRMKVFSNWYSVELMHSGLREPATCRVNTWKGLKIHVRDQHELSVLDEVFISKVYDPNRKVPSNGVIVDVGAHIGSFSLYAASVRKARRVFSYEPCPDNFTLLKENIERNGLGKVITPIAKAVAATNENRTLHLSSKTSGSHSLFGKGRPIQVQCVTLKQILDDNNIDHVDFLKLDCEGAEVGILQNIDKLTLDSVDRIGMEFHDYPRQWFVSRLLDLGFSVVESKEAWRNELYIIADKSDVSRR